MANGTTYDLIVIGGGAIGLATAYQAAKRNLKTLVLEQYDFFNDRGASAGASRQFRLQYAIQYMSELCVASEPFWADLQQYANSPLVGEDGSLWFGDPSLDTREGGIAPAEKVMDALGIPYTKLDQQQIEASYYFRNIDSNYRGFFQAQGGTVNLHLTEVTLYKACANSGLVTLAANREVNGISSTAGGGITVSTSAGEVTADMLAITAGPWVNDVTRFLGCYAPIYIWEMSTAYFEMMAPPPVMYETWFYYGGDKNDFYGFPVEAGPQWPHPGYIRVAPDFPDRIITDPSQRSGKPDAANLKLTAEFVKQHMTGIDPTPHFASTCIAPLVADPNSTQELLIDHPPSFVPNSKQIVVYTAGWAGKFVPILGDMICQMLTDPNISSFNYGNYSIPVSNFAIAWDVNPGTPPVTLPKRRRIR